MLYNAIQIYIHACVFLFVIVKVLRKNTVTQPARRYQKGVTAGNINSAVRRIYLQQSISCKRRYVHKEYFFTKHVETSVACLTALLVQVEAVLLATQLR
jgi:hypothetical protein